jgi:hypothetical protein
VAAPTFGAEGAGGRALVTKAQEGRGRKTLAQDTASGAGGGADEASEGARRPWSRVATSAPKVQRSWTRGHCQRVKWAPVGGRDKGGRV